MSSQRGRPARAIGPPAADAATAEPMAQRANLLHAQAHLDTFAGDPYGSK
jgi:hypothetical protein